MSCDINSVLQFSCWGVGCHGSTLTVAMLDMESPGVEARLLNMPANHLDILDGSGINCPPAGTSPLIDGNNPDNSWILKKVNGTHNGCGSKMPVAPRTIDAKGMECLREWVFKIAGKDPSTPPMTGGTGGMPATGGSGGTAGAPAGAAAGSGGTAGGFAGSSGSAGAGGALGGTGGTGGIGGG